MSTTINPSCCNTTPTPNIPAPESDDTDSSLYKLYINNATTDAGWKKLIESLRLAERKTPELQKLG
jgi:hypothetical protein